MDKNTLLSTLDKIKGDVEKILDGNTFNSTYVADALRLLHEFNETLAGLSVSGNDKTIVDNLLVEVKDTTDKLTNLSDLVVVPEVVASGGAIFISGNDALIDNSVLNRAVAVYGGGIYLNHISSSSKIVNVIFRENKATKNGGAIDCNASYMGLNNTQFISNYAGEYGAALCRETGATNGHGYNNTFISNHAEISGAALAWMGVSGINITYYHYPYSIGMTCNEKRKP